MGVHGLRQPDWTLLLTQFVLLLVIADIFRLPSSLRAEDMSCGCWGANQIYVHYSPPVSGWFKLSRRHHFTYERVYSGFTNEPQRHHFQLRYMRTRNFWVLLEKKAGRSVRILSNRRYSNTKRIIVSCPTGQCSCQKVLVSGSSCWSMNGNYSRSSSTTEAPLNSTATKPTEKKRKRSECLLAQLARCLINKTQDNSTMDNCHNYTLPLTSNSSESDSRPENYVYQNYVLRKDDDHDFWFIESMMNVYAVSRNTGPCPDQLTPNSTAWIRTDEHFRENIKVTCISWDSPSGD